MPPSQHAATAADSLSGRVTLIAACGQRRPMDLVAVRVIRDKIGVAAAAIGPALQGNSVDALKMPITGAILADQLRDVMAFLASTGSLNRR